MDINVFDLSNYKVPYFYERKLSSFTYDVENWKKSMNDYVKKFNFPIDTIPWGEKRNSEKIKILECKKIELLSQEELGSVPMCLHFNYYSNIIIKDKLIDFCWEEFKSQINLMRITSKLIGKMNHFDSILRFPKRQFASKIISEMPESGFAKNVILGVKEIYQNFSENKKFPVFMGSAIPNNHRKFSLKPEMSFCELLINYEYFLNSPVDIISGGILFVQSIDVHISRNENLQTIEELSNYVTKKLNFSKNKTKINIFIDRSDLVSWNANETTYENKSYYIRDIKIFEKKDNYYEDLLNKIPEYKKIYDTIIEYKPDVDELDLDDCKLLLDEIIKL